MPDVPKNRVPAVRIGLADYAPDAYANLENSLQQWPPDDETMAVPAAYRPGVPLPGTRPDPGPSLHPPCRWWRVAPGFPWECYPLPPPLPPPPLPPHFLPPPSVPFPPWLPPGTPDPWPPAPPKKQP